MHLKSLTLRGFKSFADPTTLEFEPGVTVVVGPNGSGKSNVVDAVAWVLGAQGPRVVRSSKMDDVIFAGTSKRPALGRAEVSLTIDNSSRRLPLDVAEVTITRTLFRSGESEYQLNGVPCRLLDIQELLSDAGVGRQQHVIMGQGQLASVLDARPEDRRAIIEEAAGILKFRRRRERAERRLAATEENLQRLGDLLREVRRQLRPLERQAQAARRHDALAGELRALRLFVAGRALDALQRRSRENEEQRQDLREADARAALTLERLDEATATCEEALRKAVDAEPSHKLGSAERLLERARGLRSLVTERERRLASTRAAAADADVVASLEAESARLAEEVHATEIEAAELVPEQNELEALRRALSEEASELPSASSSTPNDEVELHALRAEREETRRVLALSREARARHSERELATRTTIEELSRRGHELTEVCTAAARRFSELREAQEEKENLEKEAAETVTAAETAARSALAKAEGLRARKAAYEDALDQASARAGVARLSGHPGVVGTLLDLVAVEPGYERAFEAAAEDAFSAVVIESDSGARAALARLRDDGSGGAVLPLACAVATPEVPGLPALRARVRATRPDAEPLLDALLGGVVVCEGSVTDAVQVFEEAGRRAVVVTRDGDRVSPRGWRIGTGQVGATRAALRAVSDEAASAAIEAERASEAAERARKQWSAARAAVAVAGRAAAAAQAELAERQSEAERTRQRLELLSGDIEGVRGELERATAEVERLQKSLEGLDRDLESLEREHAEKRAAESAATEQRRHLEARMRELEHRETALEVRVAGLGERRIVLSTRRDEIEDRLAGYEAFRARATERRLGEEMSTRALARLGSLLDELVGELGATVSELQERRRLHEARVEELSGRLSSARSERSGVEREMAVSAERRQRLELEQAELNVRLETALESLRHDLEVEPAEALASDCPELPPGTPPAARVKELEREIRLLGPVNPLALEELAVLEERDRFLSGQLEDVRQSRRELSKVIRAVDEEIVSVFSQAFSDVANHFEQLFATLFPGGSGQLCLVEPENLLSSGVEIEARPAGRNVRRLSLLSGGERSLVALAFLFAVFRSRPSPFYLMDEVEAALDDVNLHRFLDLVDEFREEAQLVVVSHQKRTMESADVIYGVTMQPGGASKVVSERLRHEREPEAATA